MLYNDRYIGGDDAGTTSAPASPKPASMAIPVSSIVYLNLRYDTGMLYEIDEPPPDMFRV